MPELIPRSTFSMRTGIASLGSIAPATQLDLALGRLGDDVPTGPITHELTHHNAANSPVNVALQYRWLELLRAALSTPSTELDERIVLLAQRLAATEALLQPIAEGLAHFAEFDCCVPELKSGGSFITAVDLISLRLLSLKLTGDRDLHQAAVAEKLPLTDRRADVLSHPLYPESMNDAYLLGYLLLKAAWNVYLESDAPHWPAGAFEEYVHYWVYEDWGLAELLLHAGAASDHAVVDHLSTRLHRLLADDLGERVDAFRRDKHQRERRGMLLRGPEEREHGPLAGLELTMQDIVDAHLALGAFFSSRIAPGAPVTHGPVAHPQSVREQMHNAIVGPLPDDEPQAVEAYFQRNPGAPREALTMLDFLLEIPRMNNARVRLIDLPVELDVRNGSLTGMRVEGGDTPWHQPPAAMRIGPDAGRHRGRLLAQASSKETPWRLDCFVVVDGLVQAMWSFGEAEPDEQREDAERIQFYETFRLSAGIVPEEYLSDALDIASLDSAPASAGAAEATIAVAMALREVLAASGWAGLFGVDPTADDNGVRTVLPGPMVRALAATGLVNSYCTDGGEVAARLTAQGHNLDALVEACDGVMSRHGVRLFEVDAGGARARI